MKRLALSIAVFFVTFATVAQTQIVAHRGYWKAANGAQNSIEAFHKADSLGVYGCEFDVWYTADTALVVNHDPIFKGVDMRTAPLDSILAIKLANGENLPLLDTYLDSVVPHPGIHLVLEQKGLPSLAREDEAAAKIVEMLSQRGLLDRTDVISFSINACLAYKKLCPQLPVYYLDGDLTPKKIKGLGLDGIDYHRSVVKAHPEWIDECHKLGLKVNVWTVDDPAEIAEFAKMGVDFVTTNNPDVQL